jgi:hypothetical protein
VVSSAPAISTGASASRSISTTNPTWSSSGNGTISSSSSSPTYSPVRGLNSNSWTKVYSAVSWPFSSAAFFALS